MVFLTLVLLLMVGVMKRERGGWSVHQKKFTYKSKKKLIFTSTRTERLTMPRVEVKVLLGWIDLVIVKPRSWQKPGNVLRIDVELVLFEDVPQHR